MVLVVPVGWVVEVPPVRQDGQDMLSFVYLG